MRGVGPSVNAPVIRSRRVTSLRHFRGLLCFVGFISLFVTFVGLSVKLRRGVIAFERGIVFVNAGFHAELEWDSRRRICHVTRILSRK